MCLSPICLDNFRQHRVNVDSPMRVLRLRKSSDYVRQLFYKRTSLVPCGKCVECLKSRQNDFMVRSWREANLKGSLALLTLTYDENHLPLAIRLRSINQETGEIFYDFPFDYLNGSCLNSARVAISSLPLSSKPRELILGVDDLPIPLDKLRYLDSAFTYSWSVTPTLRRRDVQLWIKRCRVQYKRINGVSLPCFSYALVGEYGPNTCRPHYHLLFFGLDSKVLHWMCSLWHFGFTDLKIVPRVNSDGSDAFNIVSKYVSKYLVKGKFDCDSVLNGNAEKGRLCISKNFGTLLDNNLVSWYRCYDKFGFYDIEKDINLFSGESFKLLADEVKSRAYFSINGFKYKLPKSILKKLWYVKGGFENKDVVCSSAVRNIISAFVSDDILDDYLKRIRQDCPNYSSEGVQESLSKYLSYWKISTENVRKTKEKDFQTQLYKSKF